MIKNFLFALLSVIFISGGVFAQTVSTGDLQTILTEAEKQTQNYREEFRNLLADETKTFQTYDKNGQPKNQRVVESTFLVYQSPKKQNGSVELRNVVKVDGEIVADSQKRSEALLAELQKTATYEKELEKIQSESLRFDKTLEINGMTLAGAVALAPNLRPFFDFQLDGTENYEGSQVYVVSYQQSRKTPLIRINDDASKTDQPSVDLRIGLPGKLKAADAVLRGKLWIDAQTYQVRREIREVIVQTPTPVVAQRTELTYQPSDYGILVPKQIVLIDNDLKKVSNGNQYEPISNTKVTFDYKNFRKTDVDIKIIDDTE